MEGIMIDRNTVIALIVFLFLYGFIPQERAIEKPLLHNNSTRISQIDHESRVHNKNTFRKGRHVYKIANSPDKDSKNKTKEFIYGNTERSDYDNTFSRGHTDYHNVSDNIKISIGILIIFLLFPLFFFLKRASEKATRGTTLIELLISMSIFLIVVMAIGSLYTSLKPFMDAIESRINVMNTSRNIKWFVMKKVSGVCEDSSHQLNFFNSMTGIRFYTCDKNAGDRSYQGPFYLYKSGNSVVFSDGAISRIISRGISSLQFTRYNDIISLQYNVDSSHPFVVQVAIKTDDDI